MNYVDKDLDDVVTGNHMTIANTVHSQKRFSKNNTPLLDFSFISQENLTFRI